MPEQSGRRTLRKVVPGDIWFVYNGPWSAFRFRDTHTRHQAMYSVRACNPQNADDATAAPQRDIEDGTLCVLVFLLDTASWCLIVIVKNTPLDNAQRLYRYSGPCLEHSIFLVFRAAQNLHTSWRPTAERIAGLRVFIPGVL